MMNNDDNARLLTDVRRILMREMGNDLKDLGPSITLHEEPSDLAYYGYARITFYGRLRVDDINAIRELMDRLNCNEHMHGPAGIAWYGRSFVIGDGDDTFATYFQDNAIHVWVRDLGE